MRAHGTARGGYSGASATGGRRDDPPARHPLPTDSVTSPAVLGRHPAGPGPAPARPPGRARDCGHTTHRRTPRHDRRAPGTERPHPYVVSCVGGRRAGGTDGRRAGCADGKIHAISRWMTAAAAILLAWNSSRVRAGVPGRGTQTPAGDADVPIAQTAVRRPRRAAPPPRYRRWHRRRAGWSRPTRWRAAATTEPGRLRIIGAVLAAAGRGVRRGDRLADHRPRGRRRRRAAPQPAAERRRRGHLPLAGRRRHHRRRRLPGGRPGAARGRASGTRRTSTTAAELIAEAAANTEGSARPAAEIIAELNQLLPEYTGLVERPRGQQPAGPAAGRRLSAVRERADAQAELLPDAPSSCTRPRPRGSARDYADAKRCPGPPWALGVARAGRPGAGRSAATTGAPTGCSTTGCWRPRPPPRWCCCGWSSGTPSPAPSSTTPTSTARGRCGCSTTRGSPRCRPAATRT